MQKAGSQGNLVDSLRTSKYEIRHPSTYPISSENHIVARRTLGMWPGLEIARVVAKLLLEGLAITLY